MAVESPDPANIRSLAVTASDLVSALEANETSSKHAVLRVTPPFSGRMRARLHIELDGEYEQSPEPIHIDPDAFLDQASPPYPRPADTEDQLRADPADSYTVDRHHERHSEAVKRWRRNVLDAVEDQITVETPTGEVVADVTVLGSTEE